MSHLWCLSAAHRSESAILYVAFIYDGRIVFMINDTDSLSYIIFTEQVSNFRSERKSPEDMRAFSKERAESCGDSAPERTWRSHGPQSPAALR